MKSCFDPFSNSSFSVENGEIRFDGVGHAHGDVSEFPESDATVAAAHLSGKSNSVLVSLKFGNTLGKCVLGFNRVNGWSGYTLDDDSFEILSKSLPICLAGDVVFEPNLVREFCQQYPNLNYVCPVVHGLSAIGSLVRLNRLPPCRNPLTRKNEEELGGASISFDPNMEDDCFGRMADTVAHGVRCLNDTFVSIGEIGVSPFYGRILSCGSDGRNNNVILRKEDAEELFPCCPIQIRDYAATSVFVECDNTQEFASASGYNGERVNIFVATDYVPGVSEFMLFYRTISGNGFVFSDYPIDKTDVMVFRHNKGYK